MTDSCVLFFIKYPEAGKVKTRLGEVVGNTVAADLYKRFVEDMLNGLSKVTSALRIYYLPQEGVDLQARLTEWLGDGYSYFPQAGANLGERMKGAMQQAFADGFDRAILMGSDVPDFPPELVQKAMQDMERMDAVVGPAYDGGYYLIGFRKEVFFPEIFDGIVWGEADVYRPTMERLRSKGLEVLRLPDWNDVDTIWDLNVLYRTNRNSSFRKSSTFALLREHNDLIRQFDIDLPKMPGR